MELKAADNYSKWFSLICHLNISLNVDFKVKIKQLLLLSTSSESLHSWKAGGRRSESMSDDTGHSASFSRIKKPALFQEHEIQLLLTDLTVC